MDAVQVLATLAIQIAETQAERDDARREIVRLRARVDELQAAVSAESE